MRRTRRGAVAVAVLAATALAGCTDDSGDGSGSGSTEQTTVTVTSTTSSPVQPEPTTGEDAVPAPDLPEPDQLPGEIVGSSDISTDSAPNSSTGGPAIGDACIGANIGMRATADDGTGIICDNYSWQVDVGQEASHPWVDGQDGLGNCIAEKTADECRAEFNG
ncbi:hypothetical protein ACTXKY_13065 [Corynebacterium variabile]|uniref:hypothetical protein n=1 Tax=Corynebacterium variabile TaxID=1727 RepID=UPI003FD48C51